MYGPLERKRRRYQVENEQTTTKLNLVTKEVPIAKHTNIQEQSCMSHKNV